MQRIPTDEPDLELGERIDFHPEPPPRTTVRDNIRRLSAFIRKYQQGLMLICFLICIIVLFALDNKISDILALTLLSSVGFTLCLRAFMIARGLRMDGIDLYDNHPGSLTFRQQMLLHQTMYGDSLWIPSVRSNSTHLRLSMMDRDFNPNDYEVLLRLDEEVRARTFTGIPQSQINRLPTFILKGDDVAKLKEDASKSVSSSTPPPSASPASSSRSLTPSSPKPTKPSSSSSSATNASASTPAESNVRKCAVCLELQLPGQTLRALPCLHNFHIDCIDPWLRIKPVCPICHIDVVLPSGDS